MRSSSLRPWLTPAALRPAALILSVLIVAGCATQPASERGDDAVPFEQRTMPRASEDQLSREDFEQPEKSGEKSSDSLVEAILKISFLDKQREDRDAERQRQEAEKKAAEKQATDKKEAERKAAERQEAERQREEQASQQAQQQAQQPGSAPESAAPTPDADRIVVEERRVPDSEPAADAESAEREVIATLTGTSAEEPAAEPAPELPKPAPLTAQNRTHAREAAAAQKYYDIALQQAREGNHEAALRLFRDITAQYPTLSGPIVNQAILLRRLGRSDEAQTLLQSSLINKVTSPYLLNELGILYREQGRFNQARQAYESAIRREPAYATPYYNLGVLADLYLHDPALALDAFRQYQSLQAEPDKQVAGWIVEIERRVKP